jgi:hypothetical protein
MKCLFGLISARRENMDIKGFGQAVLLTLGDSWEEYAAIFVMGALFLLGAMVLYALIKYTAEHVIAGWRQFVPAVKLARSWLWEKRMRERNRAEAVKVLASDAITEALDNLLLEGKLSKKERNYLWKKMGQGMDLPDLLVRRVKHPKAIIADVKRRHIDKTPVPLPDLQFSAKSKFGRVARNGA